VRTDRTILNSKLDSIICDYEKGACVLIDVAISGDRNVIWKEAKEIRRYKTLQQKFRACGI